MGAKCHTALFPTPVADEPANGLCTLLISFPNSWLNNYDTDLLKHEMNELFPVQAVQDSELDLPFDTQKSVRSVLLAVLHS